MWGFIVFHSIRELLFIGLSVAIIIFFFKIRSDIDALRDLKVKTTFALENTNYYRILKKKFVNDEINKYEEFFRKYKLKEGQTFKTSAEISDYFNNIYRLSLAIIILLIIFILPSVFPCICLACLKDPDDEDYCIKFLEVVSIYIMIGRDLILFILFLIYLGFFISYKIFFENIFFELFDNINNNAEKIEFEKYYISFFDLKTDLLINIILQPICIFICFGYVLFYYDPCGCLWKRCLKY